MEAKKVIMELIRREKSPREIYKEMKEGWELQRKRHNAHKEHSRRKPRG